LAKSVRVEVGGRWAGGGRYIWGVHKDCPEGVHKDCPLGRQPVRVALFGRGGSAMSLCVCIGKATR